MNFKTMIKLLVGFISGVIFWFFFFLVILVYAFMPVTKQLHEKIFIVVAQLLYLLSASKLMNKIFGEKGWKSYFINMGIIALMAGVALLLTDFMLKLGR